MTVKDETGHRHGRLVVLHRAYRPGRSDAAYWLCQCDCGNTKVASGSNLRHDQVRSCGCIGRERRLQTVRAVRARRYYHYRKANGYRQVDPTGTIRRVQALACNGYSQTELSGMLGWVPKRLSHLIGQQHVHVRTAAKVAALYDKLWATQSTGPRAGSVRAKAEAKGWAPPLAWDDDQIDNPEAVPVTTARRADWQRRDKYRKAA